MYVTKEDLDAARAVVRSMPPMHDDDVEAVASRLRFVSSRHVERDDDEETEAADTEEQEPEQRRAA